MKNKTELIILTGFLGSGKSTLLKRLLKEEQQKGRRIAVIMNEVGKVSVDSATIPEKTPIREMLNGCICCSIQGDLTVQIKGLLEQYELDTIYIEATGVAHPLEIMNACTHPQLIGTSYLKSVITTVHAKQWFEKKMSIKMRKLMNEQIRFADLVIINHTDRVDSSTIREVEAGIKHINENAHVYDTSFASIQLPSNELDKQKSHLTNEEAEFDAHIHHSLHIRTVTLPILSAMERVAFTNWLCQKDQLYRAKGFIQLHETPGMFLFNLSYGDVAFERLKKVRQQQPILVLIGERLDREMIESELSRMYV
ncbi:GTP-binding protein [Halalkalibacter sp. AB-rgal2]|uniref:CobW family GTP-binding protein n=1 Tax=Halalkalibacter sp. AB-rgal2 TaxID=3242695 RepID=UPI00359E0DF6